MRSVMSGGWACPIRPRLVKTEANPRRVRRWCCSHTDATDARCAHLVSSLGCELLRRAARADRDRRRPRRVVTPSLATRHELLLRALIFRVQLLFESAFWGTGRALALPLSSSPLPCILAGAGLGRTGAGAVLDGAGVGTGTRAAAASRRAASTSAVRSTRRIELAARSRPSRHGCHCRSAQRASASRLSERPRSALSSRSSGGWAECGGGGVSLTISGHWAHAAPVQ